MAHGAGDVLGASNTTVKIVNQQQPNQSNNINNNTSNNQQQHQQRKPVGVMGSRRIFAAAFKLKVLDSYRNDIDCRGNQRATARKYGIHRRQIQKWLQCEDNLRSSCADNGVIVNNNTTVTATPVNIVGGNTSNNKSTESTIISCIPSTISSPTPAAAATAATAAAAQAPALNLSLARLHGDELVGRQGPPPPPQTSRHPVHPPAESPTSNQSYQQGINTVPVHTLLIGYTEFTNSDSQHNLHHHNHIQHNPNHQQHQEDTAERKYYTLNHSVYDQTTGYHITNDTRIYEQPQPLTYQSTTGYNGIVNDCQLVGTSLHQTGHVLSCGNSSGNSSPAIKNERASPDSPATPGSCIEAPSSPDNSTTTITTTTTNSSSNAVTFSTYQPHHHNSTNGIAAVHFEPHVHIRDDTHSCTVFDSNKSLHKQHSSDNMHQLINNNDNINNNNINNNNNNDTVKQEIKMEPELSIPEDVFEEQGETIRSEERECSNYQCSERSLTSISPSPRGMSSSSGQSTTSCSDSETDPLDFSSLILTNVIGDLSRRRSFSLRFKLDVLDAFHRDIGVAGNQRATARKFGINRRQVQKWLGQESELRGEIALRGGDMRQRLGPLQEIAISESPVDLTTANLDSDQSSALSPIYFCDSSTQRLGNHYTSIGSDTTDISQSRICNQSCCTDNSSITNSPINLRTCYPDTQPNYYCYSERDHHLDILHDRRDLSLLKRSYCTMNCCYESLPLPKRMYVDDEPQEMPLCLVIPKQLKVQVPIQIEPVTSTVPTPPAIAPPAPPPKKDAILFKPYLDNPISKPTDDSTTLNNHGVNKNNNNCHSICNINEERESHQDYAVELSLKLPVSWRTHHHHHHHHHHVVGGLTEFTEGIRSAFDRYPSSPHYA